MATRFSSKTFNNILIIGITLFIFAINLPRLLSSTDQTNTESLLTLLPNHALSALIFSDLHLVNNKVWSADRPLTIGAAELVERWKSLKGTPVNDELVAKLEAQHIAPQTVMVQRKNRPAIRLTYYEFPRFWLFQHWQKGWLAVSVDKHYLFPFIDLESSSSP